ncbi:MAG: SRPBCC family protein [Thiohalospira sp.]|uniref:SRPBCC family protein n=1 Tax=Thiohalorhabdus sp. TaxID=3094134 RepID=UPI00397F4A5B
MGRVPRLPLLLALLGLATAGSAETIRHLEVERDGREYSVRFEAVVEAPPDRVFALLTDYDRLERLNPGIVAAERLGMEGGMDRVRTVLESCVAFFCRQMDRIEEVRTRHQRTIESRVVPEQSEFESGHTRWQLAAVTEGTRIRFRTRMVPEFWVPPVIGPWAIRSNLESDLRGLIRRLEELGESSD